jgi:hypothetical protein
MLVCLTLVRNATPGHSTDKDHQGSYRTLIIPVTAPLDSVSTARLHPIGEARTRSTEKTARTMRFVSSVNVYARLFAIFMHPVALVSL